MACGGRSFRCPGYQERHRGPARPIPTTARLSTDRATLCPKEVASSCAEDADRACCPWCRRQESNLRRWLCCHQPPRVMNPAALPLSYICMRTGMLAHSCASDGHICADWSPLVPGAGLIPARMVCASPTQRASAPRLLFRHPGMWAPAASQRTGAFQLSALCTTTRMGPTWEAPLER